MKVYRIRDWEKNFENSRTRDIKNLTHVMVPNRQDGGGYAALVSDHESGAAHFGAWIAILEIASKCSPRGALLKDGKTPHSAKSLSVKCRFPESTISEALDRLCSEDIGWIEIVEAEIQSGKLVVNSPPEHAETAHFTATTPQQNATNGTERNGTEVNGNKDNGTEGRDLKVCRKESGKLGQLMKSVDRSDFNSTSAMARLFRRCIEAGVPGLTDCEADLLAFLSTMELALRLVREKGGNPAAFIVSRIKDGTWRTAIQVDEDLAKKRFDQLKAITLGKSGPPPPFLQDVAKSMSLNSDEKKQT